ETAIQGITEGVLQASYVFDQYKADKTTKNLTEISLLTDLNAATELVTEVINLMDSVNITRDLVNTPANDLYPETLANKVTNLFEANDDVIVDIYNKKDLEELGTEALLAVAQGSAKEPRLIVLKYLPLGDTEPAISLVGK